MSQATIVGIRYNYDSKRFECDLGPLNNSGADLVQGIPELILVFGRRLNRLLADGPMPRKFHGGTSSATRAGDRVLYRIEQDGRAGTWELFEARGDWEPGSGHNLFDDKLFVGKRVT